MVSLTKYPVSVPPGAACLQGLVPFDTPGRSPLLPPMYQYIGHHPLRQMYSPDQRTFVYLVDSSTEGKELFEQICLAQKVPEGPIGKPPFVNPGM